MGVFYFGRLQILQDNTKNTDSCDTWICSSNVTSCAIWATVVHIYTVRFEKWGEELKEGLSGMLFFFEQSQKRSHVTSCLQHVQCFLDS